LVQAGGADRDRGLLAGQQLVDAEHGGKRGLVVASRQARGDHPGVAVEGAADPAHVGRQRLAEELPELEQPAIAGFEAGFQKNRPLRVGNGLFLRICRRFCAARYSPVS